MEHLESDGQYLKRNPGRSRLSALLIPVKPGVLVRFGTFELRLDTGELQRHGIRIHLQRRSFQILEALLERPGDVVTREFLMTRLWADGTHVDFESGLNTAVNRLRAALNDSAENPMYVETLARIGYRFIAPVETLAVAQATAILDTAVKLQLAGGAADAKPLDVPANTEGMKVRYKIRPLIMWGAGLIGAAAVALFVVSLVGSKPPVTFRQITFSAGFAGNARFKPDGGAVIYSGRFNENYNRIYSVSLDNLETRDLGLGMSKLASVSASDMAFFSCGASSNCFILKSKPVAGGPVRLVDSEAVAIDFGPHGKTALARETNGVWWLEYPVGHKLYTAHGWLSDVRVSPDGKRVAFAEHPTDNDDAGQIIVVEQEGNARVVSSGWGSVSGVAWNSTRGEVWFTAARFGVDRSLMAVDKAGRLRQVAQVPGGMLLRDINAQGTVLIARPTSRVSMFRGSLADNTVSDISWLDWSRAVASSADAKLILFDESGQGGGQRYSIYIYDSDKHTARRLSEGRAMDLSRDGRWALTQNAEDSTQVRVVSVADGQVKPINTDNLEYAWARFLPGSEGTEILFAGSHPGTPWQLYRQHLPDGKPQRMPVDLHFQDALIDAKAETVVGLDERMNFSVLDLPAGTTRSVNNPDAVRPVGFFGRHTLLTQRSKADGRMLIEQLNLDTGKKAPQGEIQLPKDRGVMEIESMQIADDKRNFVYSLFQSVSTLFVVSGWT